MKKFLITAMLAVMLTMASSAFATHKNLFNFDQPTDYQPNPSAVKTVTADYTATVSDHMLLVNASAAVTITLPPMSTTQSGKGYIIKRIDSSTNTITVAASTTDSSTNYIGGAASRRLAVVQDAVLSISYGSGKNWDVKWETPPIQADMSTGTISLYTNGNVSTSIGTLSGAGMYTAPTVSTTFTLADCGKTIGVATDALTHVLPNSTAGCCFTFTNTGAAGNNVIKIDVDSDDQIFGTVTLAASVVVIAGAAGDSISLTKATSIRGDSITLCGVGSNVYNIISSTGIWADTN